MKYGQYVTPEIAHDPASRCCPRCAGLVLRYRSGDLDDALDWFVWQCALCARMFRVTESGAFEQWVRSIAA